MVELTIILICTAFTCVGIVQIVSGMNRGVHSEYKNRIDTKRS
jgi:hypothetical protein